MSKQKDLHEQAIALRAEGKAYASIASELSLPIQDVIDITSKEEYRISTLQGVRMETLIVTQRADRQGRIEQLTSLQAKLREELERRDLSLLPTDKLISLLLKTTEVIKGEVIKPEILSTKAQQYQSALNWDNI